MRLYGDAWYWKACKIGCANHNRGENPLGPDCDEALHQYHEIMAKPEEKRQSAQWGVVAAILGSRVVIITQIVDATAVPVPAERCLTTIYTRR